MSMIMSCVTNRPAIIDVTAVSPGMTEVAAVPQSSRHDQGMRVVHEACRSVPCSLIEVAGFPAMVERVRHVAARRVAADVAGMVASPDKGGDQGLELAGDRTGDRDRDASGGRNMHQAPAARVARPVRWPSGLRPPLMPPSSERLSVAFPAGLGIVVPVMVVVVPSMGGGGRSQNKQNCSHKAEFHRVSPQRCYRRAER